MAESKKKIRWSSAWAGARALVPPTDVTGSTIAMLNDTCGNFIQLTQLGR